MEITKSDIVLSVAGRDRGKLFYVLDTDGVYVPGQRARRERLENPKKKAKHVRKIPRAESRVARKISSGEKVLNSELRRELAVFGQTFNSQNQGG